LALAVAEPGNSGLGGGGFALVYDPKDKQTTSLDFRERAPIALDLASLKDEVKENPDALRTDGSPSRCRASGMACSTCTVGSASCR
jgi:gamma-glutamyltranspeptidase